MTATPEQETKEIREGLEVLLSSEGRQKNGRKECTMKLPSILGWYRILRSERHWTIFQSIRYAVWLAR